MKTRLKTTNRIALALAVFAVIALLIQPACEEDPADPVGDDAASPFGVYSPGSLAEVSSSAGATMIGALGLNTLADYEAYSVDMIGELGVSWVRVDFYFDGWRFKEPAVLKLLRDAGFTVVGTARPVNHSTPRDLSRFEEELAGLVSRYPWIRTWQIGNEPNIKWDPADYARLFLSGEKVVREQCPDCSVALAGVAARYPNTDEAYTRYQLVLDVIDSAHGNDTRPFDVFDIHYYGDYGADTEMLTLMQRYGELVQGYGYDDVRFWVTETSTVSSAPGLQPVSGEYSEEKQASELVRRFVTLLGGGAERVSWARPYENYRYRGVVDGYYDLNAIVYNGLGVEVESGVTAGTRKLAFYSYQTLIRELDGFSTVEMLAPGQYRFGFDEGREPVRVAWASDGLTSLVGVGGPMRVISIDGSESIVDAAGIELGESPLIITGLDAES